MQGHRCENKRCRGSLDLRLAGFPSADPNQSQAQRAGQHFCRGLMTEKLREKLKPARSAASAPDNTYLLCRCVYSRSSGTFPKPALHSMSDRKNAKWQEVLTRLKLGSGAYSESLFSPDKERHVHSVHNKPHYPTLSQHLSIIHLPGPTWGTHLHSPPLGPRDRHMVSVSKCRVPVFLDSTHIQSIFLSWGSSLTQERTSPC